MRYEQQVTLKNGEEVIIRSLEQEDAGAVIFCLRKVTEETDFLMREVEECGMTIAQQAAMIESMLSSPREVFLGAFAGGELIGLANMSQAGPRLRVRHRARIGIMLLKAHWGKGIGKAMMRAGIDAAKAAGYEQLELDVVDKNTRAAALYTRLGFEAVGKIPRGMKYRDGGYADLCLMIRQLGKDCLEN